MRSLILGVLFLSLPGAGKAQQQAGPPPAPSGDHPTAHAADSAAQPAGMAHADHGRATAQAPYAAIQNRDIKALSEEEIESLRAGEGMGFALAAELNGYPGPKHALELADSLGLTDEQRARIQALMDRMSQQARELGRSIVTEERAFDAAFADRSIRSDQLLEQAARIGEMRGRLRAIHLAAHLETSRLLTHTQHEQYKALRGYDTHAR